MQATRRSLLSLILLIVAIPVTGAGLPAGTSIYLTANSSFSDPLGSYDTISVSRTLTVAQSAAVAIEAGTPPQSPSPGMTYYVPIRITNTGNGTDTFRLSIKSDKGWSTSVVLDENADGIRQLSEAALLGDTGTLPTDAGFSCFAGVSVPSGATTESTITVTATSMLDLTASTSTAFVMGAATAAPKVIGIIPVNGESGVALKTEILVTFDQAMDRQAVESAVSVSPELEQPVYDWMLDGTRLCITHADYSPGTTYTVSVATSAKSADGASLKSPYSWSFKSVSTACFEPDQIAVVSGEQFTTPPITLDDPSAPTSVSFTVGVPEGFGLDTTNVDGSLVCVQPGVDTGKLTSSWDEQTRKITISAEMANPGSNVEVVSGITLAAPLGQETRQLTINDSPALTVSASGYVPGDFNGSGDIDADDLAQFNAEWVRWRRWSSRAFDPAYDAAFDLAPRTSGPWPAWTPIGDSYIDIWDATAFIESWVRSQSPAMDYGQDVTVSAKRTKLYVTVDSAPYGIFQANIQLPPTANFNPAVNATTGNLIYVIPQREVGSLFYSEYDPGSRTIRLAGTVSGKAPYSVAMIYIY